MYQLSLLAKRNKEKFVVIYFSVFCILLIIINSVIAVSASTRDIVFSDEIVNITNVEYSLIDNVKHIKITVKAQSVGIVRVLYTSDVNDETLKRIDTNTPNTVLLYDVGNEDNTYFFEMDITEDIVFSARLFNAGNVVFSSPVVVYLSDFENVTEPTTELTTEPITEPATDENMQFNTEVVTSLRALEQYLLFLIFIVLFIFVLILLK